MVAGLKYIHDLAAGKEERYRNEPAAQRLAECDAIRPHPIVLAREQAAGAAKPGLDLVADQKHVSRTADSRDLRQVAGRRHVDPAFTLDRLDQKCGCVGSDSGLERGGVAKRHELESRRERTKAVAILRHGREAHNGDGAAVEIAFRRNDLGAFGRYALDLVGPFAHRLERSLDRLGTSICWQ